MSNIKVMPMELANKIAAGEVIDRPSSVIKELVENAIDARATSIEVNVHDGGRTFISVSDNGIGMDKDDAILCFERHASSKVKTSFDLNAIHTLGFRGEAIPSIASISKVTLITSNEKTGTKITVEPGKGMNVENSSLLKGTTFEIRDLYFNVPARLKFLKSDRVEKMKCIEKVQELAIGNPHIKFTLYADEKLIFATSGRGELKETIYNIDGPQIVKNLIPIQYEENGFELSGFIANPEVNYSTNYQLYIYLNNRNIYSFKINKAILNAYKDYLPPNRFPYVCLLLKLDPYLVDVNVHPSKKEVRISNEDHICSVITNEILNLLSASKPVYSSNSNLFKIINKDIGQEQVESPLQNELKFEDLTQNLVFNDPIIDEKIYVNNSFETYNVPEVSTTKTEEPEISLDDISLLKSNVSATETVEQDNKGTKIPDVTITNNFTQPKEIVNQTKPFADSKVMNALFSPLTVLGQISNTYIVFDCNDGMLLIDQHAAAERINFEKYEKLFKTEYTTCFPLNPLVITVPYNLFVNFDEEHINTLKEIGIALEHFGDNSVKVSEVPEFLLDKEEYVRDIIFDCLKNKKVNITELLHLTIASIACKASVKANKKLSLIEIEALVNNLRKCRNPANCPHGRPTVIVITKYELEKLFRRTGF